MNVLLKIRKIIAYILLLTVFWAVLPPMKAYAEPEKNIVIVIDPGHGGENEGGLYEDFVEKNMTPIVAKAMKEHLEKFEGVTVFLTRDGDTDLSLEERVKIASDYHADFLFCLHFNLSVSHDLFGAEVWIPSKGEYYSKGYAFAEIEMQELTNIGLFNRGIKTRLNSKGEDYYGIIRHGVNYGIPVVLIEHCHLDHAEDVWAASGSSDALEKLGRLDAEAVAKYYHLKSVELNEDYTDYAVSNVPVPQKVVAPDESEPDINEITLVSLNEETAEAIVSMKAVDYDSFIMYYMVSMDGGATYSELKPWPRKTSWNQSEEEYTFTVQLPYDTDIHLKTTAYNSFDRILESNEIFIPAISSVNEDNDLIQDAPSDTDFDYDHTYLEEETALSSDFDREYKDIDISKELISIDDDSDFLSVLTNQKYMIAFLIIVLLILIVIIIMILNFTLILKSKRIKKKRAIR